MKRTNDLAVRPPLGWNSWITFGEDLTEDEAKAQIDVMVDKLVPHGYDCFVVDALWYGGLKRKSGAVLQLDGYGRPWPHPEKYPSSRDGAGFRPLADHVHARGLKFGVHVLRGIPRQAVQHNLPILNSAQRAGDVADKLNICPWVDVMWGLDMSQPGARAYYESVIALLAEWTVDFIKVDDIVGYKQPGQALATYNARDVEAIRQGIDATGRPMIISISPGDCADPAHGSHLEAHTEMARVSCDFWDTWEALRRQLATAASWAPFSGPGFWPDLDMLPLGRIGLRHASGDRATKFTPDEQRLMMTLWAIARSPLIMGGDLARLDAATLALITNPDVLAMNQQAAGSRELFRQGDQVAWTAVVPQRADRYLALFNLGETPTSITVSFSQLGLHGPAKVRDLWARRDLAAVEGSFVQTVPPHGAELFLFQPIVQAV